MDLMFADFLTRLFQPNLDPLPDPDARLALAALLIRVGRSDGQYDVAEASRIERILTKRYDLPPDQAAALRSDAEQLESEAPDTVRFTRAIKDAVPYEDRRAVLEAAWLVVLADGQRAGEEDALMRLIANLLGVNDLDSNRARQKAARQ